MSMLASFLLLFGLAMVSQASAQKLLRPRFNDHSRAAGIDRSIGRKNKHGGASIADLDGDGWPDLLLNHHSDRMEVYFNNRNGTFKKSPWNVYMDIHALTPFRREPNDKRLRFILTSGGFNGNNPSHPSLFSVQNNQRIVSSDAISGLSNVLGRGRSALFLSLVPWRSSRYPDAIFTNAPSKVGDPVQFKAARGVPGDTFFSPRALNGYSRTENQYLTVTDINGDRRMEVLTFHNLSMYRVRSSFTLREMKNIWPPSFVPDAAIAVAEIDFDNDGDWDLYVGRATRGTLEFLNGKVHTHDYLLRNDGGRYVDVSRQAGIPRGGMTRGVTVGDFNNDGFIDIAVTRYSQPGSILWNKGDGTFSESRGPFGKRSSDVADAVTSLDYDRDGKLDILISEGTYSGETGKGFYRLMKNNGPVRGHVLIRVGSSPSREVTSLHAVVKTTTLDGKTMMRRVGTPGCTVSVSYQELIHFGVGSSRTVNVEVVWTNGEKASRTRVASGSLITIGYIP